MIRARKYLACISAEIKPYMLSKSYSFSSNNSEVLAQVWGKNITTAEFMEKVYPGSLEVLPKDTVERLKNEPMVWPDPQKTQPDKKQIVSIGLTWLNSFSANHIKIYDLQYNKRNVIKKSLS